MREQLLPTLIDILVPVVLALLSLASAYAVRLIHAYVKNVHLRGALLRINDAVPAVVAEISQIMVPEIRKAAADGKISEAEAAHIKRTAVANIKDYLGTKGLADLISTFGKDALDAMLAAKIEEAVVDLKASQPFVLEEPKP